MLVIIVHWHDVKKKTMKAQKGKRDERSPSIVLKGVFHCTEISRRENETVKTVQKMGGERPTDMKTRKAFTSVKGVISH